MIAISTRLKNAITVCDCLGFFTVGVILAILGPTLLDLADNTHSSVTGISRAFTARSCGYLVGSIVAGKFFDSHFSSTCLVLGISIGLAALGSYATPLTHSLSVLCFIVSFQGLAMGVLDTGGNILLLRLWGKGCGPYLQTLHASFGVGAFVSPFIAQAFIANHEANDHGCDNAASNATLSPLLTPASISSSLPSSTATPASGHVAGAYAIAASLMLPVSVGFLLLHRHAQPALRRLEQEQAKAEQHHDSSRPRFTPVVGYSILLIGCLFFFCYVGMEVAYGGYLFSYAVKNCSLRFTATQAAHLTSVFWGLFALGRILSIPLSMVASPMHMTLADLLGAMLAALLLVVDSDNPTSVWLSSGLFGLSLASVFPSGLHLLEQYIPLTGAAASAIVVGASAGEMALPLLVGTLFGQQGPETFPKVGLRT